RTARPPSRPTSIAVEGDTAASIAAASIGSSKRYASISQEMSTSSGSRVLREGTIATSSNPYALRAVFPAPISNSMGLLRVCSCRALRKRETPTREGRASRTVHVGTLPGPGRRCDEPRELATVAPVEQRITLVTLGVKDVAVSKAFYE